MKALPVRELSRKRMREYAFDESFAAIDTDISCDVTDSTSFRVYDVVFAPITLPMLDAIRDDGHEEWPPR